MTPRDVLSLTGLVLVVVACILAIIRGRARRHNRRMALALAQATHPTDRIDAQRLVLTLQKEFGDDELLRVAAQSGWTDNTIASLPRLYFKQRWNRNVVLLWAPYYEFIPPDSRGERSRKVLGDRFLVVHLQEDYAKLSHQILTELECSRLQNPYRSFNSVYKTIAEGALQVAEAAEQSGEKQLASHLRGRRNAFIHKAEQLQGT